MNESINLHPIAAACLTHLCGATIQLQAGTHTALRHRSQIFYRRDGRTTSVEPVHLQEFTQYWGVVISYKVPSRGRGCDMGLDFLHEDSLELTGELLVLFGFESRAIWPAKSPDPGTGYSLGLPTPLLPAR